MKNEKRVWKNFYRKDKIRLKFNRLTSILKLKKLAIKPKYNNYRCKDLAETYERIAKIIEAGNPALIARFGSVEARALGEGIGIKLGAIQGFSEDALTTLHRNAGVFPYGKEMAMRFADILASSAKQVDLLGVWDTIFQEYLIKNVCSLDLTLTNLGNLEPYYGKNPWTSALKGKKVLVIHPFKDTIESQYKKRKALFKDENVLPEFDLKVLKAVQTIAGTKDDRFKDWEDALNFMYDEAMKIDFDVAIIGCGAYGMPLGAKLKESGKIAIHLGGATQILFGIMGNRWEANAQITALQNEQWTRPSEDERPKNAKAVEGACYW